MKRLDGKVAVVTGGAAGIGETTVRVFAREGATVSIWDVDREKGEKLSAELTQKGNKVEFRMVDVSKVEDVAVQVAKIKEKYGHIDILINNAGITRDASLLKMEEKQWDQVISVNLKGVFVCAQAVGRIMAEQGSGVIINTSSVVALYGNYGQTNYVAAKSGIIGMTKTWARELGRKGVRVNAVAPGFIATEMVKTVPEKVINAVKDKTPLARLGEPEDIANAYLFLSSDEASFINGNVLCVDGGLIL
ncbi:MAG: 3-oxoacyl-ACP reductase FabG [Calditrichaceae bacterium]